MLNKRTLDQRVAETLDLPMARVSLITQQFLSEVKYAILYHSGARLDGLGVLSVSARRGKQVKLIRGTFVRGERGEPIMVPSGRKLFVIFRKSEVLKAEMDKRKKEIMEKLGVDEQIDEQEELEKKAAHGCPECGAKVIRNGKVLLCPTHGSEPFERSK